MIAPDLRACALPDFDELVVPVLALRNHALHADTCKAALWLSVRVRVT